MLLSAAAPAFAASGGASPAGGARSAQPANATESASANGITFSTPSAGLLGRALGFSGQVTGAQRGERVEIQRRKLGSRGRWQDTTHGITAADGSFSAQWPANHAGRFALRAVVVGTAARSAGAAPTLTVTVYRSSRATVYGPGFYGHRTACGVRLRPSTLGVASRTLPCGTSVSILYAGQSLVVPVIDRGPYANGADWDLTEATAKALGIPGTVRIGATPVPGAATH